MKRTVSLLFVIIMCFGLLFGTAYAEGTGEIIGLPGTAAEDAGSKGISLKYDDRYTFTDAKSIEVEDPCIEVSGNTIRAAGITDGPVTVTVDGAEYSVTVEKAVIDIFVLDGQSNANGDCGTHDKDAIVPDIGCGYYWADGSLRDCSEFVRETEKKAPRKSVGLWPALEAEWYALTGEKAVVMNIAHNGAPIQDWASGYDQYGVSMIESCIDSIDTELFTIAGGGYFWFQGESNSDIYHLTDQMRYTTTEEYIAEFNAVHDSYISAFATRSIAAFAGIFPIRNWGNLLSISRLNEYTGPRAAHQYLANSREEIFMVSSLGEIWDKTDKAPFSFTSKGGYEIEAGSVRALFAVAHYTQMGYDILGLEAADGLYSAWRCGDKAEDFVLYGQDASTVYEEDSVVYLDDNLRITGTANTDEKFAAQFVVVPMPREGACSGLSMTLTRCSDGFEITGVMTDSGYIADISAVDEDAVLTVRMGELSHCYTLTKRQHKLAKGPENKNGSFEFLNRSGAIIDSAGLRDKVCIRSEAKEEGYIPTEISVYETQSGKTLTYSDDGMIDGAAFFSFRMPSVDVTVKAKYIRPGTDNIGYRYTVQFDKNAEAATGTMKTMSGTVGQKSVLTANRFEYEGHRFCGWNTAPDGTGNALEEGEMLTSFVLYNNRSITLYAQWEDLTSTEEIPDTTEAVSEQ